MKKLALLSFACTAIVVSCKNKDYKEYEGTWNGTYSGEDFGDWNMDIDEEGNIDGTARSDSFSAFPISIEGTVSKHGDLDVEASSSFFDITFIGELNNEKGNGSWRSYSDSSGTVISISGAWTGKKD